MQKQMATLDRFKEPSDQGESRLKLGSPDILGSDDMVIIEDHNPNLKNKEHRNFRSHRNHKVPKLKRNLGF